MNQDQLRNMVYAGKGTKEFIQNLSEEDLMEACNQFHAPTGTHFNRFISEISFDQYTWEGIPAEVFVSFGLEICEAIKDGRLQPSDKLTFGPSDKHYQSPKEKLYFEREQLEHNLWIKVQAAYDKHKTKLHNKTIKKLAKIEAEKEKFTVIEGKTYKLVEVTQ